MFNKIIRNCVWLCRQGMPNQKFCITLL